MDLTPPISVYAVYVGRRMIYSGPDEGTAHNEFRNARSRSMNGVGWEGGHDVTMYRDSRMLGDYPGHESAA